jgi:hypothetical protein
MKMKMIIYLIILLSFTLCVARAFTPPDPGETLRVIGNIKDLPIALQRALNPSSERSRQDGPEHYTEH